MKPLHTASFWGNVSAVEVLVKEAKLDPNTERNEQNQWLPIHYACDEGQLWAIYSLVTNGADIWSELEQPPSDVSNPLNDTTLDGEPNLQQPPSPLDLHS